VIFVDTDGLVDILRGHPNAVAWLHSLGNQQLGVCGLSVMELIAGEPNRRGVARLQRFTSSFLLYWPDAVDCDRALGWYAKGKFSHGLGILDALIGATAIGLSEPLHSFNHKHFQAIPGLTLVAPYAR